MKHLFDFTYRGHEIVVMEDGAGFACDIRDDEYDGELIAGYCDQVTQREAVVQAIDYVDQYIYDQTHFTVGISI